MKTYLKIKIVLALCVSFVVTSCSLDLQENFDFKPEVDLTDPYDNITAWEFMQQQTSQLDSLGRYPNNKLDYMVAAIKKAGMEEEYNQVVTNDRTYLLMDNLAFNFRLAGRNVIRIITGSPTAAFETADQVMERVDTPEKLEKLRKLLRYHIVDSYIAQVPTLVNTEERYLFQTLVPEIEGSIVFSRTSRWQIQINTAPAPLPTVSTQAPGLVLKHNYVFNNGIGQFINASVRYNLY